MTTNNNHNMTHRYMARVVLEATTPLFVGSGESSLITDATVQKDPYGFPMIPGTSLTGVLRHALEDKDKDKGIWNSFFGYQGKGKEGEGSQVRISSAYLILKENKVADIHNYAALKNDFPYFEELPTRQHVRITDKGVGEDGGLFDNEVVYKGCRFVFEIELRGTDDDKEKWQRLLQKLNSPNFRIGQGTRNGYGNLSVFSCATKIFDLTKTEDFNAYLDYDPCFNQHNDCLSEVDITEENSNLTHYQLKLQPDDFFIFSKGAGDEEVDNVPNTELVVSYNDQGTLQELKEYTLIPASSIKGAIAHRTAFHYNKLKGRFADELIPNMGRDVVAKLYTGSGNKAVNDLFGLGAGFEWSDDTKKEIENKDFSYEDYGNARRGKVIIDDCLYNDGNNDKIFNHVAIDRFTGGAMDGALFSEKVSQKPDGLTIDIYVEEGEYGENVMDAFEEALFDITNGLLPLGGMTTKGHGMFTGLLEKK